MRITILIVASCVLVSSCANQPPTVVEQRSVCEAPQSELEVARQAFFYAFPLYEMNRMRQRMLSAPGAAINSIRHRTTLSRPEDRSITTPNNDTLYSSAWLDLSAGSVRFSIPSMGSRYHSVEMMNAFSDAFAILRNETADPQVFLIVGPDWAGRAEPDETIVRSPTRDAWLVARTHVTGAQDLGAAQWLQNAYTLEPAGDLPVDHDFEAIIPDKPDGSEFLSVVNTALARGPLPQVQSERLHCFSGAGIGSGKAGALPGIDTAMRQVWDDNIDRFYAEAMQAFEEAGTLRDGWRYPESNIAEFGTDDVYRTAMALGGLAALPLHEASYPMTNVDAAGVTLNGQSKYTLRIPGNVPVDGFWSMTLYESDGAGRWFLYKNPIHRYAISSTTEGLDKGEDGGIVVQISHDMPSVRANWLPAPAGDFRLVFRAYRPQRALIEGAFKLPPVERTEAPAR